jgi:hypothetical protein
MPSPSFMNHLAIRFSDIASAYARLWHFRKFRPTWIRGGSNHLMIGVDVRSSSVSNRNV